MSLISQDKIGSRDLFAREASITNEVEYKKKLFIADTCKFDITKSELFHISRNKIVLHCLVAPRGFEAVNITI